MGKIPFYVSHNFKMQGRMRRRRKWILRQIRGASRVSPSGLRVEHNTLHPDRAVSLRTFKKDLAALREEMVVCAFCKQPRQAGSLIGKDAQ